MALTVPFCFLMDDAAPSRPHCTAANRWERRSRSPHLRVPLCWAVDMLLRWLKAYVINKRSYLELLPIPCPAFFGLCICAQRPRGCLYRPAGQVLRQIFRWFCLIRPPSFCCPSAAAFRLGTEAQRGRLPGPKPCLQRQRCHLWKRRETSPN